jgi:hypothetical protein
MTLQLPDYTSPARAAHYEALASEVEQRRANTRAFNQALAQRRILDREFYYENRGYIRIPVNAVERDRNQRWAHLNNLLHLRRTDRRLVASGVSMLRTRRAQAS